MANSWWCSAFADDALTASRHRCIRLQHLETFEFRSLLTHELVGAGPREAIIETVLVRLDGIPVAPGSARRCAQGCEHCQSWGLCSGLF